MKKASILQQEFKSATEPFLDPTLQGINKCFKDILVGESDILNIVTWESVIPGWVDGFTPNTPFIVMYDAVSQYLMNTFSQSPEGLKHEDELVYHVTKATEDDPKVIQNHRELHMLVQTNMEATQKIGCYMRF